MNATEHRFTSDQFTYVGGSERTFYAEASTLGWSDGNMVIKSARTGVESLFRWVDVHRDADGDVVSFRFEGVGAAEGVKAVVYND